MAPAAWPTTTKKSPGLSKSSDPDIIVMLGCENIQRSGLQKCKNVNNQYHHCYLNWCKKTNLGTIIFIIDHQVPDSVKVFKWLINDKVLNQDFFVCFFCWYDKSWQNRGIRLSCHNISTIQIQGKCLPRLQNSKWKPVNIRHCLCLKLSLWDNKSSRLFIPLKNYPWDHFVLKKIAFSTSYANIPLL